MGTLDMPTSDIQLRKLEIYIQLYVPFCLVLLNVDYS